MRTRTIVMTMGCSIMAATALAGPPKLPAAVAKDLADIAAQCTEMGGKAQTGDAVKRVDLNGDGKEDYLLNVGAINCEGAPSIYGDREKMVTVYVGDGAGGAKAAFSEWVYGAKIEGAGSAARLWLTVSGGQCGKPPAKDFASENFCDRPITWNAKAQMFDYAPVSSVRMIQ